MIFFFYENSSNARYFIDLKIDTQTPTHIHAHLRHKLNFKLTVTVPVALGAPETVAELSTMDIVKSTAELLIKIENR